MEGCHGRLFVCLRARRSLGGCCWVSFCVCCFAAACASRRLLALQRAAQGAITKHSNAKFGRPLDRIHGQIAGSRGQSAIIDPAGSVRAPGARVLRRLLGCGSLPGSTQQKKWQSTVRTRVAIGALPWGNARYGDPCDRWREASYGGTPLLPRLGRPASARCHGRRGES